MIQAPEGMNYYIFRGKTRPGRHFYGGFIGEKPQDINLLNYTASLPDGTAVDVCQVSKERTEELETELKEDENYINMYDESPHEGNRINDMEVPERPDGWNYYIYKFQAPNGRSTYGGFIGERPEDVNLLNYTASLPEGTAVDVCQVSKERAEELETELKGDEHFINMYDDSPHEGNRINDMEVPEPPPGWNYYIYKFEAPYGRVAYGGFIAPEACAVENISLYKEFPPLTEIDVVAVDREKFIHLHTTLQSSYTYAKRPGLF